MAKNLKFDKKGIKCPSCPSSDAFFRILDEFGKPIEKVGKCFSCGEFFKQPYSGRKKDREQVPELPIFFHNQKFLENLRQNQKKDNFTDILRKKYAGISAYLDLYNVCGTSLINKEKWQNCTAFPKIDYNGKIRGVKLFKYDNNLHTEKYVFENEKGRKKLVKKITWVHSQFDMVDLDKYRFEDCFFGEHLIYTADYKYIGVVESEKTAVIMNYFLGTDWIFLATGSKSRHEETIYKGINEKKVFFFPDADGYNQWAEWLKKNNNKNWQIVFACQMLKNKQDPADLLLETNLGDNFINSVNTQIKHFNATFGTTQMQILEPAEAPGKKTEKIEKKRVVTVHEILYYDSILSKLLTTIDVLKIFEELKIEDPEYQIFYEKKRTVIKKANKSTSLFEICNEINQLDFFYNFLTIKHIPKFEHVKNFTFSFTDEEFLNTLANFDKMYFDNLIYNISNQKFEQKKDIITDFELKGHIRQTIQMVELSFLNEKGVKFLNQSKNNLMVKFIDNLENKRIDQLNFEKTIGDHFLNILEKGKKDCERLNFSVASEEHEAYIYETLQNIFDISNEDIIQLMFFCAATIRKKFYDDFSFGKLLFLHGDSGVGKDTFFPSLLSGAFNIDNSDIVFSQNLKVNNFNSLTPEMAKKIMYNVISDDLDGSNNFTINDVTNAEYAINNKGVQMKVVKHTFNPIITNNFIRVFFNKELDKNAIARRFVVVNVKYLGNNNAQTYLNFFKSNTEHFFNFYASFFTFCFEFAKNIEALRKIESKVIEFNLPLVNKLFYLNNEDQIVIDNFVKIVEKELQNTDIFDAQIFTKKYKGNEVIVLDKFDFSRCSPKKELSLYRIKQILTINFPSLEFGKLIKINGQPKRVTILNSEDIFKTKMNETENLEKKPIILQIPR